MTNRRTFLRSAGVSALLVDRFWTVAAEARSRSAIAPLPPTNELVAQQKRFPCFQSTPVSYRNVVMRDRFWAPRQKATREVSVPWITQALDRAGGLRAFKSNPTGYVADEKVVNRQAIKFIEAMATVVGLQRDRDIEGLIDAWIKTVIRAQGSDGYLEEHFPPGADHPGQRWQAVVPFSHESYTTGHYIEAAIAYQEATGDRVMYQSAVRVADNMVTEVLGEQRAYTSGHPEIEQALMRLYGETGETKYLRLCGWLLDQRGHHEKRPNYGPIAQDDIPIKEQRTIEGHAVMAAYLFNGATHYVGATGDVAYRQAILSVWNDFVTRKMYIHGAGGNRSTKFEGYRKTPYCIPPDDTYGESCSVFANFQWAHSLFRLTGEAQYIDTAERMLYNAFYASLSLKGDTSFYCNAAQVDYATPRSQEFATSCCPPNIVKLFNKVGGFFYSTDVEGIYVNHFGASEANIPFREGVKITQRTEYPWDGAIALLVEPKRAQALTLRLRLPTWVESRCTLSINGRTLQSHVSKGWLVVHRYWRSGDRVDLNLPMVVKRIIMSPEFKGYENRAALQRGPIVYCLEEQDLEVVPEMPGDAIPSSTIAAVYIPENATFEAEHQPDFLGGVTVLKGEVPQVKSWDASERILRATWVPYGVWDNRTPGSMRIWLGARKAPLIDLLDPQDAGRGGSGILDTGISGILSG